MRGCGCPCAHMFVRLGAKASTYLCGADTQADACRLPLPIVLRKLTDIMHSLTPKHHNQMHTLNLNLV